MPHSTHRKSIARAYAAASGEPYTRALAAVDAAAAAQALPDVLDVDGVAAAVEVLQDRARRGLTGHRMATAPRNIRSQHIVKVDPEDLVPGHVTIYGVVLDKRPTRGGYFVDYPHSTVVFVTSGDPQPVICKVDENFLGAVVEAYDEEQDRVRRR